jgi:hypothetical protein
MAARKANSGALVLIIVAFAVLTVGMGLDGGAGIAMTLLAIAMFIIAIIMGIIGGIARHGGGPPAPPGAPPPAPPAARS